MARKFIYAMAIFVVILIAAAFALALWPGKLSEIALVPDKPFQQQAPVAAERYADAAMWVSRPDKGAADPARWLPEGVPPGEAVPAAVFFIHPTSYLDKASWNAPLDDQTSRNLADTMTRGLASPFNQAAQLWAPRYRQATFGAFLSEKPEALQALDAAYGDVAAAFEHFLANVPADQPIVLVGHSQGAYHLRRLLKDRIAGQDAASRPIAGRIAAVYAIGWPVSLDHDLPLMGLPACARAGQSGCVVSWLSYGEPADPAMTLAAYARRPALDGRSPGGSNFLCSNPLTGGIGGSAPAEANLGTLKPDVAMKSGTLLKPSVSASCRPDGFLSIGGTPDLGPYVLPGNNYHIYDIPLFWANLRKDFGERVKAWKPA